MINEMRLLYVKAGEKRWEEPGFRAYGMISTLCIQTTRIVGGDGVSKETGSVSPRNKLVYFPYVLCISI